LENDLKGNLYTKHDIVLLYQRFASCGKRGT